MLSNSPTERINVLFPLPLHPETTYIVGTANSDQFAHAHQTAPLKFGGEEAPIVSFFENSTGLITEKYRNTSPLCFENRGLRFDPRFISQTFWI